MIEEGVNVRGDNERGQYLSRLVEAWPALTCLSFGFWLAAVNLSYSGTGWLSDTEMNGYNLSTLFVVAMLSCALPLLAEACGPPKMQRLLARERASILGGAAASVGSFIVVASGPYYLEKVLPLAATEVLFVGGAILFGFGLGIVALRCGAIFGRLSPSQVVVYAAFSECIVSLLFFIVAGSSSWAPVAGGPSFVGAVVFMLLPLLAGFLSGLSRYRPACDGEEASGAQAEFPGSFWKLLLLVFSFAFIVFSVYGMVVRQSDVEATFNGTQLVELLRLLLALGLALAAQATRGKAINFGRMYPLIIVGSVALVALIPVVAAFQGMFVHAVSLASVVFELFLWCTLAFVVHQRRFEAKKVYGYGWGLYLAGSAFGWLAGSRGLEYLADLIGASFAYMCMALFVLVMAFIVFSENDLSQLFSSDEVRSASLDEIIERDFAASTRGAVSVVEKRRRFADALDLVSDEYRLTPRESDVLRCVAMGYDSKTIADKLVLSLDTVRTYRRNLYGKLGVHSRQELVALVEGASQR